MVNGLKEHEPTVLTEVGHIARTFLKVLESAKKIHGFYMLDMFLDTGDGNEQSEFPPFSNISS